MFRVCGCRAQNLGAQGLGLGVYGLGRAALVPEHEAAQVHTAGACIITNIMLRSFSREVTQT